MDKKKLLILFFVAIIFGNQLVSTSVQIVKGGLGLLISIFIIAYISPSMYDFIASNIRAPKEIDTAKEFQGKIEDIPKNILNFFDSIGEGYCKNREKN